MVKMPEFSRLQRIVATTELLPRATSRLRVSKEALDSFKKKLHDGGDLEAISMPPDVLREYEDIHQRFLTRYGKRLGKRWIEKTFRYYKDRVLVVNPSHMAVTQNAINDAFIHSPKFKGKNDLGIHFGHLRIIAVVKPKDNTHELDREAFRWTLTEELSHALLETPALQRRMHVLERLGLGGRSRPRIYEAHPAEWLAKGMTFDVLYRDGGETIEDMFKKTTTNRMISPELESAKIGLSKMSHTDWADILKGKYLAKDRFGDEIKIPKLWFLHRKVWKRKP